MRTTVNLDTDTYEFAHAYAGGRGITLSAAINELVRCAERTPESGRSGLLVRNEYGYLEIADTGIPLTPEMVKVFSEDAIV